MGKLWRGILVAIGIEAIPLVLVLLVLHIIGIGELVQALAVLTIIGGSAAGNWQGQKTARNADLAAALARGHGTYIIGDKKIERNLKPLADRIGVPLAGVQPGAAPRDPVTGERLITERLGTPEAQDRLERALSDAGSLPTPPEDQLVNVEGWGVRQDADGNAHYVPPVPRP